MGNTLEHEVNILPSIDEGQMFETNISGRRAIGAITVTVGVAIGAVRSVCSAHFLRLL